MLIRTLVLITLFEWYTGVLYGQNIFQSELLGYDSLEFAWNYGENAEKALKDGMAYLAQGYLQHAVRSFSIALKCDSTITAARYYRAVALKLGGQTLVAELELKSLVKSHTVFFEAFIELGKVLQLNLKPIEAKLSFLKAAAIRPLSARPIFQLGQLSFALGAFDESKDLFEKSLRLEPDFVPASLGLVMIRLQAKDEDGALKLLDEILLTDPSNEDALQYRVSINTSRSPKIALRDLEKLINLFPNSNQLYIQRAKIYVIIKNYPEAFADLRKVLLGNSIDQDAFRGHQTDFDRVIDFQTAGYYVLQQIYGFSDRDMERIKEAYCLLVFSDFNNSIKAAKRIGHYKRYAFCQLLIGMAYQHKGDHANALSHYKICLKLDDEMWEAHKKVAIYLSSVAKWEEAEIEFSKAIAINPNALNLYKLRGVNRFTLQDYEGAERDFARYLKTDSLDKEAVENQVAVYEKLGKFDLAIENFLQVGDTGTWSNLDSRDVMRLSNLFLAKGDTVPAVDCLNRFFNVTYSKEANDYKFTILLDQADSAMLKRHLLAFERFVEKHPNLYQPENLLIIKAAAYSKFGELDKANYYFEQAEKRYPYNSWIFYYRARMSLRQGDVQQAIRYFKKADELGLDRARDELKKLRAQ